MLALPEFQLEQVLVSGLEALKTQPTLFDELFALYPASLVAEVKTFFTKDSRVIPVKLNWPRTGASTPSFNIVNAGDTEEADKDTLDSFMEETDNLDTDDTSVAYYGNAKRGTYQILCLAPDPREALYMSLVAESLFIINRESLLGGGLHEMTISSSDLRFEEQLLPEFTNSRLVTLTCLHYHAVPRTTNLLTSLVVNVHLRTVIQP